LDRYCLPDYRGKNLIQNGSFEQGFRYYHFRHRGKQNFALCDVKPVRISDTEALFGSKSLSIYSTPDGNLRQPLSTHSVLVNAGTYTLSVYAKSDAPGEQKLLLQMMDPAAIFDGSKWPRKEILLTDDWQRYSLTHTWKSPTAFPIVLSATANVPATCTIDGLQLEAGDAPTLYEPPFAEAALTTSAADNFLEYGQPINAALDITATPGLNASVDVKIRDFFDTVVYTGHFVFTADDRGKAHIALPISGLPRGIFITEIDFHAGQQRRYEIQRFSIMSFLDNSHRHKSLFVNTYVDPLFPTQIYRDVLARKQKLGYGARTGFVNNDEQLAQMAKEYGIDSALCRIAHNGKTSTGRNVYVAKNIEYYLLPGMQRDDAMLLENLQEPGRATPELLQQLEDAAAAIVSASPSVTGWTFMCEPEGVLPEWASPAFATKERFLEFVAMECAAVRGIKRGNPAAKAINSPTANISRPERMLYFDRLLAETARRGVRYDAISAHNYRSRAPEYPTPMESEYEKLFAILDRHGYQDAPVYAPEGMHWLPIRCRRAPFVSDYPISSGNLHGLVPYTYDLSFAEKLGAAWRARTWLLGLKLQKRIASMNASNYGTFAMDAMLTPYAFQKIPNTLGRLLGNAEFIAELELFPNTRCYLFNDEQQRPIAAFWACHPEVDYGEAKGPEYFFTPLPELELFDLMEAEHDITPPSNGLFRLPLSPFPVFIRGAAGQGEALTAMLRAGHGKANLPTRPTLAMRLISAATMSVQIDNTDTVPLNGKLFFRAEERPISIATKNSTTTQFALPTQLSAQDKTPVDVVMTILHEDGRRFSYDRSFVGLLATHAQPAGGGQPADWLNVPAIAMNNRVVSKAVQRLGETIDDQDLSASYQLTWDEQGLYLRVVVKDNVHAWSPRKLHKDGWRNDSLQVFFDTGANARDHDKPRGTDSDDWSYGIFLQDAAGQDIAVYRYAVPDGQLTLGVDAAKAHTLADDVTCAFRKTPDGYVYELAFSPRSILPLRPQPGQSFGMAILINDSDEDGATEPRARLSNSTGGVMPNDRPDLWPLILLAK
ncbi:MAG: hypothetical protein GX617_08765, partial [Lentisphaerae bacterium]|nr:hypothetical protein [Lentisphaerota bacterium]